MDRARISAVLNEIGLLLELVGENPFKARAYYQAARIIDGLDEDLEQLVHEDRLGEVPGIGPALKEKIATLVVTGNLPYYESLRSQVPPGLLDLLHVPGLGPRKAQTLHRELGITDLNGLEKACLEHRLQGLTGFGVKTELKILAGLDWLAKHRGLHLWTTAQAEALALRDVLDAMEAVEKVAIAGSLRRFKELVKDIDLVASTAAPVAVAEACAHLPMFDQITALGETKVSGVLTSGINVDLRLVTPAEFPSAFLHLTGSREHNTALRGRAKELGFKLNEYGLSREDGEPLDLRSEEEIYTALGLAFIPPELREDLGEIEAAAGNALPELVTAHEVRGALHNHTTASDGTATMEEMTAAAAELGWNYIGLADHSQSAGYAGGLKPEAVLRQLEAVRAHNQAGRSPYILAGIESEIRPDGSLDYPDEILARLDYVVASIHSGFNLDRETMTARVLKALRNPYTTVLGHPTGRLLLQRDGYALDIEAVLAAAAGNGVAIEINASPYRLDLEWSWCRRAPADVVFWINPDAHSTGELSLVPLGVMAARKGWLTPERVGNTWSLDRVRDWLGGRRAKSE